MAEHDAGLENELEGFEPHPAPSFPITIDGQNYPCSNWRTVESARFVEKRYDRGVNGGMGAFLDSQVVRPGQIYTSVNLDPTTFPYIRMRPGDRDEAVLTLSGLNTNNPMFGFVAEDSNNVEYLYILNSSRAIKIKVVSGGSNTRPPVFAGDGTVADATTQFANGIAGRPAYFESSWRASWGASVDAQTLATVGTSNAASDTWTPFTASTDDTALHFAVTMDENVAKLWKAYATNQIVSTAAVADAFAGSDEVGDSSFAITDLLSVEGRLFVSRPDRPWWFDSQRNSAPALEFVGAKGASLTNFSSQDGSQSGAFGPYVYWCHSSGLWRIFADSAGPIDPFSQRDWSGIALDSLIPSFNTEWLSFEAWGRWAYATNKSDGVYVGWIEGDGTVTWMGCILSVSGTSMFATMRCGIAVTSLNPILWVMDSGEQLVIFDLNWDGSLRQIKADGFAKTDRGGDNEQGQIWWPGTNFGAEEQKQIRVMSFKIYNNSYANVNISARIHRDRASTSIQLGSDLTSASGDGYFEFTPNSNSASITSSSVANPTVIAATTHGFASGDIVTITGHGGSSP